MSDKLQKYKEELTTKLNAYNELEQTNKSAQALYDTALAEWEKANPELVAAKDGAALAAKIAKDEWKDRRTEIRRELEFHFASHPKDQKAIDAFGFRIEIDVHWLVDPALHKLSVIQSLAQTAPFLLDIDHKAVLAYVKANAIELEKSYGLHALPPLIFGWHGKIFDAQNKTVPLVYDKYLAEDVSPKL